MQKSKESKVEELPIEEFENDNQDFREEFLKRFKSKSDKDKKVTENKPDDKK